MSPHAADGAALVAAAVAAAIRERASLRTVAAVAAAVAGRVLAAARPDLAAAVPQARTQDAPTGIDEDAGDPVQLLAALRCSRRAQRQRKKERRRLAKQAAQLQSSSPSPPQSHQPPHADAITEVGAAGPRAEPEGAPAAVPALAPTRPPDPSPPDQAGLDLQLLPSDGSKTSSAYASTLRPENAHLCGLGQASEAASAGMPRPDRPAPYGTNRPKAKTQPRRRET